MTECDPTARVVILNVAFPVAIVPVPNVVVPSLKVTVPVAVDGVVVAVNLTEAPKVQGLRDAATVTEELTFQKLARTRLEIEGTRTDIELLGASVA